VKMRIAVVTPHIATTGHGIIGGGDMFNLLTIRALKNLGHSVVLCVKQWTDWEALKGTIHWGWRPDAELVNPDPRVVRGACDITFNTYGDGLLWYTDLTYMHTPFGPKELEHRWKKRLLYQMYRVLFKNTKSVLTNSEYSANIIFKTMGINAHVLYPPIDHDYIRGNCLHDGERGSDILTVARLTWEKNLTIIPEIANMVKEGSSFYVLGNHVSEESSRVIDAITKRCSELDLTKRVFLYVDAPLQLKFELMRRCRVYLNTCPDEHFGMSIAEAMSAGLYPVVPSSGGQVEVVPSGAFTYRTLRDAVGILKLMLGQWNPQGAEWVSHYAEKFSVANFQNNLEVRMNEAKKT